MTRLLVQPAAVLCTLGLVLATASGCNALDFAPLATAEVTLSEEFQTSPTPKIVVSTFNGTIDVSPSAGNQVVVDVTKRASGFDQATAEANLAAVEVTIVQKEDVVQIVAQKVAGAQGNLGANVVIAVPKAAQLQLATSNGHVVCEGLSGTLVAKTSNGKVDVYEGAGQIEAATSNGAINIEATDATVSARTSNGRIKFHGTLAAKPQTFKTSNGRIELALPADSQFRLAASTSNSRVQCDFPIEVESSTKRRHHLSGTVGKNPLTSIVAATSNGAIEVHPLAAK